MAHKELDSFILKFKNLWQAGRNATLSFKSIDGRAEAHLSVELGDAPAIQRSRNGPSRQLRRERRAAARKAAEQANIEQTVAEEASIVSTDGGNLVETNKGTRNDSMNETVLNDEFCNDNIYLEKEDDSPVNEFVLEKTCQEDFDEESEKNNLEYNLKILGIMMITAKMKMTMLLS